MTAENEKLDLYQIAVRTMQERGFLTEFSPQVLNEVKTLIPCELLKSIKDMRNFFWVSIDNEDSKDLDQLTYAENNKFYVAIADVDCLVKINSAIDQQAAYNTTSVYTPTKIFPMLPFKLSNDLSSLNENTDRLAIVVEMQLDEQGAFSLANISSALVRNHAQLIYSRVATWLKNPSLIVDKKELSEQIQLQNEIAQKIKKFRHDQGFLTLSAPEYVPLIEGNKVTGIKLPEYNQAHNLIENFMIAANVLITKFLLENHLTIIKRVVRTPKNWDRIVELAFKLGETLPSSPNVKALQAFLLKRKKMAPDLFQELSLTIIKLIGKGEYVVGRDGEDLNHFDLALKDYTHATAPNRRYPDLILQRILKSYLQHQPKPYSDAELSTLASHCTLKEDDAVKVERKVKKSAAALFLKDKIGMEFEGIITGASKKGTWIRLRRFPIEGKIVQGFKGLNVGDKVMVRLVQVDIQQGYIDFVSI